ncbi:hypothetical protein H0X32_01320 [Patescibacteria group bacterium]|nr:hypothetical protein [Patescibacteria group bacterium]
MAYHDDYLGTLAVHHLQQKWGDLVCVLEPGARANECTVAFFTSNGNYRNRHMRRLVLPRDVEERGFVLPLWTGAIQEKAMREGVRPQLIALSSKYAPDCWKGFCSAVDQIHSDFAAKIAAVKIPRDPNAWRSGHQARRRQNFQAQVA